MKRGCTQLFTVSDTMFYIFNFQFYERRDMQIRLTIFLVNGRMVVYIYKAERTPLDFGLRFLN